MGFVQVGSESGWRTANTVSFRNTAKELGITLKFLEPTAKQPIQENDFREFVANEEVNVIVLDALRTANWEDELMEARATGKIVIVEDRPIDASEDLYAAFIGSDFEEQGRKAGRAMVELLKNSHVKNILELAGTEGSQAAEDRARGFREAIQGSGIVITQTRVGNFYRPEGKQVMQVLLEGRTDEQAVFVHNDDMALGAIEAIRQAGLRPGVDIKIVSIDGTRGALSVILAGELNVTVECSPLYAPLVYEAALKAMNGEQVPKRIMVEGEVFSSDTPNLEEITENRLY